MKLANADEVLNRLKFEKDLTDDIDLKDGLIRAIEITNEVLDECDPDLKDCRTCKEFYNGYCYNRNVNRSLAFELENYKVAETGLLNETIKSAIEQHYKTESANKDDFEMNLTSYLYGNYKMSDKRVHEIVNEAVKIRNELIPDLAEYIEDFINDLYQRYEEGLVAECQPSYYKNEAVSIDNPDDFSCKWWE